LFDAGAAQKLKRRQVLICHRFGYPGLPTRSREAMQALIELVPTVSKAVCVTGLPPGRTGRYARIIITLTVFRTHIRVNCFASRIRGCDQQSTHQSRQHKQSDEQSRNSSFQHFVPPNGPSRLAGPGSVVLSGPLFWQTVEIGEVM